MKKSILLVLIGALTFVSCKKEEVEPTDDNTTTNPTEETVYLIATSTTMNNETVELYALTSQLATGYTKLFAGVKDSLGNAVDNATVTYMPMMDMGTMQHSCPLEQPVFNSSKSLYEGMVVFTMASTAGTWTLDVNVNGNPASFTLTVNDSPTKVVGSYMGTDGSAYIVSLVKPVDWTVGMNGLNIMIHKKETMMSFPADDSLTVTLDPEMVSMGHGSPNNISPVSTGNGYYAGEVNFTMTGDWRLHLELARDTTLIHSDAYLDILF